MTGRRRSPAGRRSAGRDILRDALQPFLEEHDRIRRMLACFDAQLAIFERAEQPDYEILAESLAYCRDYLDAWHHPREERMLELLQTRSAEKATAMSALGEQHRDLADTTSRVVGIFNDVAQRGAIRLRENLVHRGRELSTAYLRHLEWEETNLFPLARAVLAPADWETLDGEAALAAVDGRPGDVTARYPALFGAVETTA